MRSTHAAPLAAIAAAVALAAAPAATEAQAVATGAGRADELTEAARIDSYLADAARAPADAAAQSRVTPAEARASGRAFPPMAPDSPWSRGVSGPAAEPRSLADAAPERPACDHRPHGEVGAKIGTGGTRGGYGVVTAPVGANCQAQVTLGVSSYRGRGYSGYGDRNRTRDAFSFGFSAGGEHRPDAPPAE